MWKTKDGEHIYCNVQCEEGSSLRHKSGDTHYCKPLPVNCQDMRDLYDLIPHDSWGTTPNDKKAVWNANDCNNKVLPVDCEFMRDHYDIVGGVSWGSAPSHVASHWHRLNCAAETTCSGRGNLKANDEIWRRASNMWKTKDGQTTYCSVVCEVVPWCVKPVRR